MKERNNKMKKLVSVTFGKNPKEYLYLTNLELLKGATYDIVADNITSYKTPVTIKKITKEWDYNGPMSLREITSAKLLSAPPRPKSNIKSVLFNHKDKITTVVWIDGSVTTVKCHPEDNFDEEKALAMCFMKRSYDNRGCFNEALKEIINNPKCHKYREEKKKIKPKLKMKKRTD